MQIILNRERLVLGAPLNQGGAGAFYAHPTDPTGGVKMYLKREDVEVQRLEWLCANRPPNLVEQGMSTHAWPRHVAYDEATGEASGFSTDYIRDVLPLQAVVDPGSRPPGITQPWLWRVAISVVQRVQFLHLLSPPHIVGDINFQNFLVHRRGAVTQLDLDSTHFSLRGGPTFTCDRCRPELQPPELVYTPSGVLDRFQHQDAFSTYMLVHRLIRDGLHPFDAHYVGGGKRLGLTDLIKQGIWPESLLSQEYRPIPTAPAFTSLPSSIQDLFRRMFQDGAFDFSQRPNVSELLVELQRHKPLGASTAAVNARDWRAALSPGVGGTPGVTVAHGAGGKAVAAILTAVVAASAVAAGMGFDTSEQLHGAFGKVSRGLGLAKSGNVPSSQMPSGEEHRQDHNLGSSAPVVAGFSSSSPNPAGRSASDYAASGLATRRTDREGGAAVPEISGVISTRKIAGLPPLEKYSTAPALIYPPGCDAASYEHYLVIEINGVDSNFAYKLDGSVGGIGEVHEITTTYGVVALRVVAYRPARSNSVALVWAANTVKWPYDK